MTRNLSCWSAPLFRKLLQVKNSYKVEVAKFEQSKAFLKMMARVSSRVGLQLDNGEAILLWNICRWQQPECS